MNIPLKASIPGRYYASEDARSQRSNSTDFMYRIYETASDNLVGCITVSITRSVEQIWINHSEYIISLTLLKAVSDISIRNLELSTLVKASIKIYPECTRVMISTAVENHYDDNHHILYLNGYSKPEDYIKWLIYAGYFDNNKIRNQILTELYRRWEMAHVQRTTFDDLKHLLILPMDMMERNLDILEQQGKIHRNKVPNEEKTMNVIILEPGIRDVDNDFKEFNYSPPIQIGAYHHYDAKTSGTGSPIIINSQNISVVNKLFDNLAQEIRNSHNLINKEVLLEEVKAAKELANRNEPSDKQHLTKKLGNLLSGTADVAQICQLVWQIISIPL